MEDKKDDYRQQILTPVFKPLPTLNCAIKWFGLFAILNIVLGIAVLATTVEEVCVQYDVDCVLGETCELPITVNNAMKAPIYVFYEMTNFYQNHRRYVLSRSSDQLESSTDTDDFGDCEPLITDPDNGELTLYPCGLLAASYFDDSFVIYDGDGNEIALEKDGIAWSSDVSKKYEYRAPESDEVTSFVSDGVTIDLPTNVTDEDFIVWMRQAALPHFRKLYRVINTDLSANQELTVNITNNVDTTSFSGEKSIVLSTSSWLGGANVFLGATFMVTGISCLLLAIFFLVKKKTSQILVSAMWEQSPI